MTRFFYLPNKHMHAQSDEGNAGKRFTISPANIYLFNGNNRNSRKMCEICSMLTIKTPEQRH